RGTTEQQGERDRRGEARALDLMCARDADERREAEQKGEESPALVHGLDHPSAAKKPLIRPVGTVLESASPTRGLIPHGSIPTACRRGPSWRSSFSSRCSPARRSSGTAASRDPAARSTSDG